MTRAVHQFVPMLHHADAVGRHTLRLRDVMVARGIRSEIYVELVDPDTAADTRPFVDYGDEAEPGDVLVYQFATASAMAPWLAARAETLVVNHHNVTPPQYYAPWDNAMARHQLLAEQQLRLLAPRAALGLAVSAFNEAELRAAGFARTAVVPPAAMLPTSGPDATSPARPGTDPAGARWIGVGRLAPNKSVEFARDGAPRRPGARRPGGDAGGRGPTGGARLYVGPVAFRRRAGPAAGRHLHRCVA